MNGRPERPAAGASIHFLASLEEAQRRSNVGISIIPPHTLLVPKVHRDAGGRRGSRATSANHPNRAKRSHGPRTRVVSRFSRLRDARTRRAVRRKTEFVERGRFALIAHGQPGRAEFFTTNVIPDRRVNAWTKC
jgi:hypothetical protein